MLFDVPDADDEFIVVETYLLNPLRRNGTFTIPYPDGVVATEVAASGHFMSATAIQGVFDDDEITLTPGIDSILVTYTGATKIPANTRIEVQVALVVPDEDSFSFLIDTRADAAGMDLSDFGAITIQRWDTNSKPSPLAYIPSVTPPEITCPDIAAYGSSSNTTAVTITGVSPTFYWNLGVGLTIPGSGAMTAAASSGTATNVSCRQVVPGETYEFTIPVTAYTSGSVVPSAGGTLGTVASGLGTFTQRVVAGTNADITLTFTAATMTVGKITCKRIVIAHYFQSSDGLYWRPSGDEINPVAMGAAADGVTDDAGAVRLADACAWAYGMSLVGQETFAVGSTVWLLCRNFSMANAVIKLMDEFPDDFGILIDWTNAPDIVTGELYVDGNRDNQSNPDINSAFLRNMNTAVAGPIFNVRECGTGVKVGGVSEEFDITVRGENCNLMCWFSDETDRPVTSDLTPNVVHAKLFGSVCNQFLRSEGFDNDSHTSFTAELYCENNVDATLPAVDLLDPRGHYELRGWLRGMHGVGVHVNQKHQATLGTLPIQYDAALFLNGLKVHCAGTLPAIHIESVSVLSGWWVGDVCFGGGLFIDELKGTLHPGDVLQQSTLSGGILSTTIYRLNGGPALQLGTFGGDLVVNGGFSSGASWTAGAGWAIAASKATHTAGNTASLSQTLSLVAGARYYVAYTISGWTTGTVTAKFTGGTTVAGAAYGVNALVEHDLVAVTGNTTLEFVPSSTFNGSIDTVSVTSSGVSSGIFDLSVARIESSGTDPPILVVNQVDATNNRRVLVRDVTFHGDEGGTVDIFDTGVDIGSLHCGSSGTRINWANEVNMQWIDSKQLDSLSCAINVAANTTVTFTPPATHGSIKVWQRAGPLYFTGFYICGSVDTAMIKDAGSATVDVSTGASQLGAISADHMGVRARSDVNSIDLRNEAAVLHTFVIRLGK